MPYGSPDRNTGLFVGIIKTFQPHPGETDQGFFKFMKRKTDGKLSPDDPFDADPFRTAGHLDFSFSFFELNFSGQLSPLEMGGTPALGENIIFDNFTAPPVKEVGEHIA